MHDHDYVFSTEFGMEKLLFLETSVNSCNLVHGVEKTQNQKVLLPVLS